MKTTKSNHSWKYHAGILSFALLVLVAGGLYRRSLLTPNAHSQSPVLEALQTEVEQLKDDLKRDELESITETVLETAQKIAPAVVTITAGQTPEKPAGPVVTYTDYRFDAGYPVRAAVDRLLSVSGFLFDGEGRVVTSARVVRWGTKFIVTGNDRVRRSARLLGASQADGLAVLQLDQLGNLPQPLASQPEADRQPVTWAVKLGRESDGNQLVALDWFSGYAAKPAGNAALSLDVHPGSAFDGGAVVTPAGRVIGIQVPVAGQPQSAILPMERVQAIVHRVEVDSRRPPKSWIGVELQNLAPEMHDVLKVSTGVLVTEVTPDGPAFRAGLKGMDVILSLNETPVESAPALIALVQGLPPGSRLKIGVTRLGGVREVEVETVAYHPERSNQAESDQPGQPLRIRLAKNYLTGSGAVIESIEPTGQAGTASLRLGDIVVGLNGFPVETAPDASRIMRSVPSGEPQLWLIRRGAHTVCVTLKEGVTLQ
ncbi:MAG: PDZ domain-containing protein [Blastocatellia bacterium]|nr:PDZ domain-containing protein [Blastocatellia bacterium]